MNEKNMIMTPFTIIDKLTGPYSFSRTNKDTLNAKSELYFHDIAFVPLFMQVCPPCIPSLPETHRIRVEGRSVMAVHIDLVAGS